MVLLISRSKYFHGKNETTAAIRDMFSPQRTVQQLGILAGNRKPQTHPLMAAAKRAITLHKRFKNPLQHTIRNADTAVSYCQDKLFTLFSRAGTGNRDRHRTSLGKL